MLLVAMVFNAFVILKADILSDKHKPWNHLIVTDVLQFALPDVRENLLKAAKSVIPHPNVADNPLNKFVDVNTMEAHMKPLLLQYAMVELKDFVSSEYTDTLMTNFIEKFTPYLDESMQQRLLLLDQKKKERHSYELKSVTARLEEILKTILADGFNVKDLIQNIILHINESSMSDEIKKAISYPIVKQELTRVLSKDFEPNKVLITTVVECLIPFLHEGVNQDDNDAVNQHSPEAAIDGLTNVLIPQYMALVKDALWKGSLLDLVLSQSYEEDNKLARDFEREYATILWQAVSIFIKQSGNENICGTDDANTISLTIMRRVLSKTTLDKKLNTAMGLEIPYIRFHNDYITILKWRLNVRERFSVILDIKCENYYKIHLSFSNENSTRLAEFLIQRLETTHRGIGTSDIKILKEYIPKVTNLAKYYYDATTHAYLSDQLKLFQEDIENEATESYGFMPGMFQYSRPYYEVLDFIFSKLLYNLDPGNSVHHSKVEL